MAPADRLTDALLAAFRLLPAGTPGKTRLARRLLGARLARGRPVVTDRHGFRYEVPSLGEPVAFHVAIDGTYEPETLAFILDRLGPGSVFVDVGANVGVFSLPAASRVAPSGRVLAVEASPEVFECLVRNAAASGRAGIDCVHAAAGATDGVARFYPAPADRFGMGAVVPQFDAVPIDVPARRLDELVAAAGLDRVDVIKIDVEGAERQVLEGAGRLLAAHPAPVIVFEFSDWAEARMPGGRPGDAQRLLIQAGYELRRLTDRPDAPPLAGPITAGFGMLVATRAAASPGRAREGSGRMTRRRP